jgi:hypothetical protein
VTVNGFTFIRNAEKYGYPIEPAIRSILPLCNQVVVAVGNSEDGTRELVASIDPKVKIIDTIWDDSLREGGRVLALETDKAYKALPSNTDWAVYIQGDEVLHEDSIAPLKKSMKQWLDHPKVEGLLFNYHHFYGSYDYIGDPLQWYPKEIRTVKFNSDVFSYRDAQGFRKKPNSKLKVKKVDAWMHHYGWVKEPSKMQAKQETFHKLWHSDDWVAKNVAQAEEFDYSEVRALWKFKGTHPEVMQNLIKEKNWTFDHDISRNSFSIKDNMKRIAAKTLGYIPGEYKNYIEI